MNGRTARRLLMRSRIRSRFCARAYVTVRVPLAAYPPMPSFDFSALGTMEFHGIWVRHDGDTMIITRFAEVSSGTAPEPLERVHHLRERHGGFYWWETTVERRRNDGSSWEPGPTDALDAWIALTRWRETFLYEGAAGTKALGALADDWCHDGASMHVVGAFAYVTFTVKWGYPQRRARAATMLAAAVTKARRAGVDARVVAIPSEVW